MRLNLETVVTYITTIQPCDNHSVEINDGSLHLRELHMLPYDDVLILLPAIIHIDLYSAPGFINALYSNVVLCQDGARPGVSLRPANSASAGDGSQAAKRLSVRDMMAQFQK